MAFLPTLLYRGQNDHVQLLVYPGCIHNAHKVTETDQSYMIGVRAESSDVLFSVLTKVGGMSFINLYLPRLPQATIEADGFIYSLSDYEIHVHLMFRRVDVRFSV